MVINLNKIIDLILLNQMLIIKKLKPLIQIMIQIMYKLKIDKQQKFVYFLIPKFQLIKTLELIHFQKKNKKLINLLLKKY